MHCYRSNLDPFRPSFIKYFYYISQGERKIETKQLLQSYFLERPLALSIAQLLIENKAGLTATELAEMLHLSVPTLYRITLEMHQQRFLVSKRQGRKNVFRISPSIQDTLPSVYVDVKKRFDSPPSRLDHLALTKTVLQDYNLSLSPRVAETMLVSAIKQKIKEHLPRGVRFRNVGPLNTVLNDAIRFDLYLGNDEKYVAIELKIIETHRGLKEKIGTLAILDTTARENLVGIILGYIISPIGGQWLIDENVVAKAIAALNPRDVKLSTVVTKANRFQILDSKFVNHFVADILREAMKALG
jgi:hypothetical protein